MVSVGLIICNPSKTKGIPKILLNLQTDILNSYFLRTCNFFPFSYFPNKNTVGLLIDHESGNSPNNQLIIDYTSKTIYLKGKINFYNYLFSS